MFSVFDILDLTPSELVEAGFISAAVAKSHPPVGKESPFIWYRRQGLLLALEPNYEILACILIKNAVRGVVNQAMVSTRDSIVPPK